jgi:hypothetical protein
MGVIMRNALLLASAALALAAAPASASSFLVTFGSTDPITTNNDFKQQLNDAGLKKYASSGATITLTGAGKITFEYMGSESGFTNRFTSGAITGQEFDANHFAAPILIGSGNYAAGALLAQFTTSGNGLVATPGSDGFGIFLPKNAYGSYNSTVLYFGFDDQINNIDDNHDDFIVRATISAVPEPATWAMMIGGFGLVGGALRRRKAITATVATA